MKILRPGCYWKNPVGKNHAKGVRRIVKAAARAAIIKVHGWPFGGELPNTFSFYMDTHRSSPITSLQTTIQRQQIWFLHTTGLPVILINNLAIITS